MARTHRALDLCALVKACAEAGVHTFEHGQIKIQFGPKPNVWPSSRTVVSGFGDDRVEFKEELDDNKTIGDLDEKNARDLQTDEMMLMDPLSYEKLQMGEEV